MNTSSGRSATAFNVPDEKVEDGFGGLLSTGGEFRCSWAPKV